MWWDFRNQLPPVAPENVSVPGSIKSILVRKAYLDIQEWEGYDFYVNRTRKLIQDLWSELKRYDGGQEVNILPVSFDWMNVVLSMKIVPNEENSITISKSVNYTLGVDNYLKKGDFISILMNWKLLKVKIISVESLDSKNATIVKVSTSDNKEYSLSTVWWSTWDLFTYITVWTGNRIMGWLYMRSSRNNEIRIDGDIFNKTLMKAFKYLDKKGIDKAQEDMILKKVNPSSIIDELSRKAVDDAGSQLADLSFDIGVSSV